MTDLLFVMAAPPHGQINAQEGLDALLMGSAFARCRGLFVGDGVYQLLKQQDTSGLGIKNFAKTFGALKDYGVDQLFVCAESLATRGLKLEALTLDVTALDTTEIRSLLADSDRIMTF